MMDLSGQWKESHKYRRNLRFRDYVLVYDPTREDKSILIPIVIILLCCIVISVTVVLVRRYKWRKAIQEQEASRDQGHLMSKEFDWRHNEDEIEFEDDDYDWDYDVY